MDNALAGEGEQQDFLLNFNPKPKRGRPTLISDSGLVHRCESLLAFFEYHWADVAWNLQRARSLPKIRAALQLVQGREDHSLKLFIWESIKSGTSVQLQTVRSELKKAEARYRAVLDDERDAKYRFEQAQHALAQFP